ncbi:MAG: hypothetical protein U1G07_10000 [Verrucomicrobiota bacterium]
MTPIVWTYTCYLTISVALTIWVARTLYRNGRIFLVDAFGGNEPLADSVNRLLLVGFYLINIGYVALALKEDRTVADAQGLVETLSAKLGIVMLVLGAMHFFNLLVFSKMRQWAVDRAEVTPPAGLVHKPVPPLVRTTAPPLVS